MTYDLFTFWNELDLLEIRLNILDPYVDYFVISESEQTFSGEAKPLNLVENCERFEKWAHKIIYINPPIIETTDPFARAHHQKDYTRQYLMDKAKDDDIVYFGDLDEVWKPQEITDDKIYNLRQLNYSYWLNFRSSEEWIGTVVGKWKTFKTNTVSHWRANHDNVLDNGGWHWTNQGGLKQVLDKIASYDHCEEVNFPWVREGMEARMLSGQDFLGRVADWKGKPFQMWLEEENLPTYLLENRTKYKHLFK